MINPGLFGLSEITVVFMKILLVSPATPATFWSYKYALRFVGKKSAFPPLGLLTLAGMLPKRWELKLVDCDVKRLSTRDIDWADYVFLGGMVVHAPSIRQISARCRRRGKTVIAGGPVFTTGYENFHEIEHFVLGEAEEIIDEFIEDLEGGHLKAHYHPRQFPPIARAPLPRWDLIRMNDYATMSVQFSRGCPFNCEFCDVVIMNGHRPRTKSSRQMIAELEALKTRGWKSDVFMVDDNFIGNKARVKRFLRDLIEWRRRSGARFSFSTEASVNLADDAELMDLMVRAGFKRVFLGIETPNETALKECNKLQNAGRNLTDAVGAIQRAGMEVMGGFIIGFDSDTTTIFKRQLAFIQEAGIATAMVGLLTPLPRTRLFQRLEQENRLLEIPTGSNTDGKLHFIPSMGKEVLLEGYRGLMKTLYSPHTYYERALAFLRSHRVQGPSSPVTRSDVKGLVNAVWIMGFRERGRRAYWRFLAKAVWNNPRAFSRIISLAVQGYHFRQVATQL